MRTYHWRTVRRATATLAATAALLATGAGYAATAKADVVSGCEVIRGVWLFKGTARSICDGVRRPDGSWLRAREFFTPAYYRNASSSCYGGAYYSSCSFSPGGVVARQSNGVETYVVFDSNVLPDEPPHLENGDTA